MISINYVNYSYLVFSHSVRWKEYLKFITPHLLCSCLFFSLQQTLKMLYQFKEAKLRKYLVLEVVPKRSKPFE